jgi:hypothetical protein
VIWDEVIQACIAALVADSALTTALGGNFVRPMEEGEERRIPSVAWTLVTENEQEVLNPTLIQLDYWATGRVQAVTIERRIRRVLHSNIRRTFGGIEMATLFEESRDMNDPKPGVVHRSLDFRFEPVKRR